MLTEGLERLLVRLLPVYSLQSLQDISIVRSFMTQIGRKC